VLADTIPEIRMAASIFEAGSGIHAADQISRNFL